MKSDQPNSPHTPNIGNPAAGIDYQRFLDCVHCGLCTSACPTYTELGDENDGPRGRIYLMRQVADGRMPLTPRLQEHLDRCLDCRACETACPSGVHYGRLIEPFRLAVHEAEKSPIQKLDWFRELVLFRMFPFPERLRQMLRPVRFLQRIGIFGMIQRLNLFKLLPGRMGRMAQLLPAAIPDGPPLPRFLPAMGRRRARVAFFVGCVADAVFRHVHWATLRVLQRNGCDVVVPDHQACCGAIHFHAGDKEGARKLADANVAAFALDGIDAVIVNHGGCGAMLKEYGLHFDDNLRERRTEFANAVQDVHEFLADLGPIVPEGPITASAAYHDSCHLAHAQRVTSPPRQLLALIPKLDLRELPEAEICCGSAGTYNLLHTEMADRLLNRKVANIAATGAQIAVAANAGCMMQIETGLRQAGLRVPVMHPMELLDLSYREKPLPGVL